MVLVGACRIEDLAPPSKRRILSLANAVEPFPDVASLCVNWAFPTVYMKAKNSFLLKARQITPVVATASNSSQLLIVCQKPASAVALHKGLVGPDAFAAVRFKVCAMQQTA